MIRLLMFAALLSSSHGGLLGTLISALVRINIGTSRASMKTESNPDPYLGCFTDGSPRMIDDAFATGVGDLTHERCFDFCRDGNYTFAGLQFSNECFCGNTIDTTAYPQTAESECNMACTGNATQVCGGASRNSLYRLMY